MLVLAPEQFTHDRDVVLAAVAESGVALFHASHELKGDKEVVLAAVSQYAHALEYADEELWRDREVVLAAVAEDGEVLELLDDDGLRRDEEVLVQAMAQNGAAIRFCPDTLIERGMRVHIQERLRAHDALMFFLLAARPPPSAQISSPACQQAPLRASPDKKEREDTSKPHFCRSSVEPFPVVLHLLTTDLGDDDASAGAAVKRLIAVFMGAPFGSTWSTLCAAAQNLAIFEARCGTWGAS
jgi:hypothetical protein